MKKIAVFLLISTLCSYLLGCANNIDTSIIQSSIAEQQNDIATIDNTTSQPIPLPKKESVSFLAVGDNIIYNGQLREGKKNAEKDSEYDGDYDFRPMYSNVQDIISSADISFINQETVMSHRYEPSQYPDFNAPQELGTNLKEIGFDIVNLATNHMLDMWYDGLEDTMDFLEDQDVFFVGAYDDKDDFMNIRIIERKGIKIAVVGFTYGTNTPQKKDNEPLFIPKINDNDIKAWISQAETVSDITVVSMHWGKEYSQTPTAEQRRLAQLIADCGGDVIIGHHTHCLQPIEWIYGKNGGKTLCFFSLGNFTSETDETISLPGGMAQFDIIKDEAYGVYIDNVVFIPTVMDYRSSFNKNTVYLLSEYSDDLCKGHNIISYFKKELNMDILRTYVSNAIDTKFLHKTYIESIS